MCWVSTTFALVSHGQCQAVKPNWAILGGTGSAILRCLNVRCATVATATQWPTLRDTACFTPSFNTFLPRPLTRCVWGGAELFVGVAGAAMGPQNAPKAIFLTPKVPKSGEGLHPFEPCSKGGTPPPCAPLFLAASAAERVATFFGNFYWVCTEEMGFLGPFLV